MIKGKFLGHDFKEIDGEIFCEDVKTKSFLESAYRYSTMDKGPADGFPEYYFLEELKKAGKDFELVEYKEETGSPLEVY